MKALVFDSGPIISLTLNGLLWMLRLLKQRFKGDFCITKAVYGEIISYPLHTKKFKLEAFQVLHLINEGVLKVVDSPAIAQRASSLMETANHTYSVGDHPLAMFHYAEMTVLAACVELKAEAAVVDEKMTRIVLENPGRIIRVLAKRMHHKPSMDGARLEALQAELRGLRIIRSSELATIAYELGMLRHYIPDPSVMPQPKAELIDAILWGLKLNGCAISEKEIKQVVKIEGK
ncbi:TPA: hypothetical protein HA281_03310 [Candidatus Woesearchaeota archaeon]|nr:hypothetical protein [Candidatus Woesearchaeota archaeon]